MSDRRQPWLKWYPADWRADPRLRMCSLAARGLWIELLGYMHEAEPYGYLVINGRTPSAKEIAALVGAQAAAVQKALDELRDQGVWSLDEEGRIYSRRMVRDKEKADRDRENGKGGGNPRLRAEGKPGGLTPPIKPRSQKPEARDQKPEEGREEAPAARPPAEQSDLLAIPLELDRTPLRAAADAWNDMAARAGLPQVQALTDARKRALRKRLADCGGIDGWTIALGKVEASKFLTGSNDRGWRADFDFVIREAAFTKLMEGKYDDREPRDGDQFRNGFAQLVAEGGV